MVDYVVGCGELLPELRGPGVAHGDDWRGYPPQRSEQEKNNNKLNKYQQEIIIKKIPNKKKDSNYKLTTPSHLTDITFLHAIFFSIISFIIISKTPHIYLPFSRFFLYH